MPADAIVTRALASGDPALIAAAVAADFDLAERAAIREFDGGMSRRDAEVAALHDYLDEVEERQILRQPASAHR